MAYELIVTEKPAAAKKVAEALGDAEKKGIKGVPYYEVNFKGRTIIVGCAVGHLFGLAEKKKSGMKYPVFDIEWVPTFKVSKTAAFAEKYYDQLVKLAKGADEVTIACDYDVEGEVIGLNVMRFICKKKDAKRMKFSTLTKEDLLTAYQNASPTIDWPQAEAGETRHYMDYYYGINLSRALTTAIKKAGFFKLLSAGRVQGPTLKIIVDREKEIKDFKPVPFWIIELKGEAKKQPVLAYHEKDKFWDEKEAKTAMSNVKGAKQGIIDSSEKNQFEQKPVNPFDLTTLQTESYRCFGINPKITLSIAQDLYTNGFISYPRTSSQQLPASLDFAKILKALGKKAEYKLLTEKLLKTKLIPKNGPKTDPAHPAIYPTDTPAKALDGRHEKVYDLIVKRFMATFGESAIRETMTVKINVNKEIFVTKGTRTVKPGWHEFYMPYVKLEEIELPDMQKDDKIIVTSIELQQKETQPPKRYSQSSIIKELEKRNLGTKSTRAEIVSTLYTRNYVKGEQLEATDLGIEIIRILETYCPKIVDEELTKNFEKDMEDVYERKKKEKDVLAGVQKIVTVILEDFKAKEDTIGAELRKTFTETKAAMTTIGKCTVCKDGELVVRTGKFGRFIACNKYPDCKTTFKLPKAGMLEVTEAVCPHCKYPMIKMIMKAKRPQEVCINLDCSSKQKPEGFKDNTPCPTCKEGQLVIRKSVYGQFVACNRFPKCHYTVRMKKKKDEPAPESTK